jgi:hypothetical protein
VQINFTARGTGNADLDRIVSDVATAFKRIERLAGIPLGYAPLRDDGLIDPAFIGDDVTLSTFMASATAAAGVAATATLPAVVGKTHVITAIQLVRAASAAVIGSAVLVTTSTNLPGNPSWSAGNLIAAGQTIVDLDWEPRFPLRAATANTATTITMPAPGTGVINRINVSYYLV